MKKITDKRRLDWYDQNKDLVTYEIYKKMRFEGLTVRQAIDSTIRKEKR